MTLNDVIAAPIKPMNLGQRADAKVALVIASMHRSGTSAVTRVFNLLGCDGARSIMPADRFNERGYWESEDITTLNDEILASAGSAWNDWEPLNPGWRSSPKYNAFLDRAVEALTRQFDQSQLLVLKDPRIARLMPLWREALTAFGAEMKVVIPIREPAEVATSLLHRNGLNPSIAQLLWLRYMLDAEFNSRDLPRAVISYDQLLGDWQGVTEAVSDAVGIAWPRMSTGVATEIERYLAPSLKHYASTGGQTAVTAAFSPWVQDVWSLLERWAAGTRLPDDIKALDRIRQAFDAACPSFARPLREHHEHATALTVRLQALEQAAADRDAARAQITDLRAQIKHLEQTAADQQGTLRRVSDESAFRHRLLNEARSSLRAGNAEIASLDTALDVVLDEKTAVAARLAAIEQSTIWRATGALRTGLGRYPRAAAAVRRILSRLRAIFG